MIGGHSTYVQGFIPVLVVREILIRKNRILDEMNGIVYIHDIHITNMETA